MKMKPMTTHLFQHRIAVAAALLTLATATIGIQTIAKATPDMKAWVPRQVNAEPFA